MKELKKIYIREQFRPGIIGLFFNPAYFSRKELFRFIRYFSGQVKGRILDIGCGRKPYQDLFNFSEYIGLDIDSEAVRKNSTADIFYDGNSFPFSESEFDSAVTTQVLEHAADADFFIKEISRVVKKDGKLLITVPFIWVEHEKPNDYIRYSSFGIKKLLEKNGFCILGQKKTVNDIRAPLALLILYIVGKMSSGNAYLNLILNLFFIAPLNIIGELLALITPEIDELYFENVILAVNVKKRDGND